MKKMMFLAVAVLVSLALCNAQAAVALASTDFEDYALGQVTPVNASNVGSFDWGGTGQMWMYSDGVVIDDGGNKVLQQKNGAMTSDCTFYGYDGLHNQMGKYIGPESDQQVLSFSFKNLGGLNTQISWGDTWGRPTYCNMQISDATSGTGNGGQTGLRLWAPGQTYNTGDVLVSAEGITTGVWHNVEILSNVFTQTVDVKFDGVVVGQNIAFWRAGGTGNGGYGSVTDGAGPVNFFLDVNQGTDGALLLDNLSLSSVPEPATMSLLALGGMAFLRRNRK